jgi:hypothetical protein
MSNSCQSNHSFYSGENRERTRKACVSDVQNLCTLWHSVHGRRGGGWGRVWDKSFTFPGNIQEFSLNQEKTTPFQNPGHAMDEKLKK